MKQIFLLAILAMAMAFVACKDKDDNNTITGDEIIYVETNDFSSGNAILAYRHTGDGTLSQISGSPFSTGGTGVSNPTQKLGPDDSDQQLFLTSDHQRLLAVNSGSNTIAVFDVKSDGSLTAVSGSPFPSGGQTPVSVSVSNGYVYVVNKSDNPLSPATQAPNYVTFTINDRGVLSQVENAKFETTPGASPTEALLSNDKKFLFGADFLGFMLTPAVGTLRSFTVDGAGHIVPVAGTPQPIPVMGGALGLWQHPKANVLYVGFPLTKQVGVYNIDATTGVLSYLKAVDAGPAICWLRTNSSGDHLYGLNSADNTIAVYNTSTATSPIVLQTLTLKTPGPSYMAMGLTFTTSEPFALTLSPTEKYLYVVNQHTNPDFSVGNFNYLHVLNIAGDGQLSEPQEPTQIPVPSNVRPQGVVAWRM